MRRQIHIVPHEDEWAARESGSEDIILTAPTQAEAISEASSHAVGKDIDLVVHRQDGTFGNVISAETLQDSIGNECKICGMGPKVFWSVLAAGAVGGLVAYLIINPPPRLEPVRDDLEDQFRRLKKRFA